MAPINDLTFVQWQADLPAGVLTVTGGVVSLNLTVLSGGSVDALAKPGVVKALAILLDAAYKTQLTVNTGQAVGERLAAFPPPSSGAIANGFAPVTRSLISRAEVATAVNVIGQVA